MLMHLVTNWSHKFSLSNNPEFPIVRGFLQSLLFTIPPAYLYPTGIRITFFVWDLNSVLNEWSLEAGALIVFTLYMIQESLKRTDGNTKSLPLLWFRHHLFLAQLLLSQFLLILLQMAECRTGQWKFRWGMNNQNNCDTWKTSQNSELVFYKN